MLIIESKKFLLPVSFFEGFRIAGYYNSESKTLLPGDKDYIKDFELIKKGLKDNTYNIEYKKYKCFSYCYVLNKC